MKTMRARGGDDDDEVLKVLKVLKLKRAVATTTTSGAPSRGTPECSRSRRSTGSERYFGIYDEYLLGP